MMKYAAVSRRVALVLAAMMASPWLSAAELKPKTTDAFNKYVAVTEARMTAELKPDGQFLYPDQPAARSDEEMRDAYLRLRRGEILVTRQEARLDGKEVEVPDGMVHHWVGMVFIPGANLEQVLAVAKDYDHRAELYHPEIIAAHIISYFLPGLPIVGAE